MSSAPAERLAAHIQEIARAHAASAPPPRGLPYLGLEHPSGTGFHLLDALSTRGIFRKYELVLDLGAGLGGTSRWLAARLGCEVVVTAPDPDEAAAGNELTRRAGLRAHVRSAAAAPEALPFRAGCFTHVWIVEALPRIADPARALAEAFRVVRPGGTLALQDLVVDGPAPTVPGWRLAPLDERLEALRRAGFVDPTVHDRTGEAAEPSAQAQTARAQLGRRLRADAALAPLGAARESLAAALASGGVQVAQVVVRRP
jgi:SAM-dependent methyltransferase